MRHALTTRSRLRQARRQHRAFLKAMNDHNNEKVASTHVRNGIFKPSA